MFIYNLKLDSKNIIKIAFIIMSIIITIFFIISIYKILSESFKVRDALDEPDIAHIEADNYTSILARDMKTGRENETLVVGFLCSYKNAKEFPDGSWVEVTATITKGNYRNEIPLLEVTEISKVQEPEDPMVCPPKDSYVPTAIIY